MIKKKLYFFVYITRNKITGEYYKGQHSTDSLFDGYLGSGTRFKQALKRYGKDAFERRIVLFLPDLKTAKWAERQFITHEDTTNPMCYNCFGGGSGYTMTDATAEKLSQSNVRRYKARRAAGDVTYRATNKMRNEPVLEHSNSDRHKGEKNPMYGVRGYDHVSSREVFCVELNRKFGSAMLAAKELGLAFQNISKVCKDKRRTCGGYHWKFTGPDTRVKKAKESKNRPAWFVPYDRDRDGMHRMCGFSNMRSKPVMCVETGEVYGSIAQAAKYLGMDRHLAAAVCDGKKKSCKGYHLRYAYMQEA